MDSELITKPTTLDDDVAENVIMKKSIVHTEADNKETDTTKSESNLLKPVDAELDYEEENDIEDFENKKNEEKKTDVEEGEDEGEISDDDLEEGEIKERTGNGSTSQNTSDSSRQVCRFYARGSCFFGNACRFLHLTEKGQYNMFSTRYPQSTGYGYSYGPTGSNFVGPSNSVGAEKQVWPPFPPIHVSPLMDISPVESAWEKALRGAKELVKKANKRKEQEPDFDKKKLDLSIDVNESVAFDYNKENEHFGRDPPYKRGENAHSYKYDDGPDGYGFDHESRHNVRGSRYENLEIRYFSREDSAHRVERTRDPRPPSRLLSGERERYSSKQNKDKERDDRLLNIQMRTRAVQWIDPWQRTKTPKSGNRGARSRSGSYSSVSSYTYSESSRSSCSYSRSSSRSSCDSARRKPSPPHTAANVGMSPKSSSRYPVLKKKPTRTSRSRSYSQSYSSQSRSRSRSQSSSRSRSVSRSCSRSRSLSMDSVSSASNSGVSNSSSGSDSLKKRNTHLSILRKDEKIPLEKLDPKNSSAHFDKSKDVQGSTSDTIHGHLFPEQKTENPFPSFQHLIPGNDLKKGQNKIKLTLLNKPTTSKAASLPKREGDILKSDINLGVKRPPSPTVSAVSSKPNTAVPKKSASSRRDELLKQLKAVEDAIARKRAKFC